MNQVSELINAVMETLNVNFAEEQMVTLPKIVLVNILETMDNLATELEKANKILNAGKG